MVRIDARLRRILARARVGHLATARRGEPAIVPICFVLLGRTLYHALDAKPKRRPIERLRRVRNLRHNPRAAVIIDHYEENWQRLWFALLEGCVRFLERGVEHQRAIRALKQKYPQYVRMPLDPAALVIALDIERVAHWRASAGSQRLSAPPARDGSGERPS